MENTPPSRRKWRWGFHRWLILLLIVGNIIAARAYSPVMPHVQVPAEPLAGPVQLPLLGEIYLTNTLVAVLIADGLLILMAIAVQRALRSGELVPGGIAGVVEAILEALYNLAESTTQKWAGRIFPWVATIVLMVLVVNWTELIPGVDSIGSLHEPHHGAPSYETQELFKIGSLSVSTITEKIELEEVGAESGHSESEHAPKGLGFTPFVRVASTDLNFTLALALTSVVMSQVIGVRAIGLGYFKKFFNFGGFLKAFGKEKFNPFELIFAFTDVLVGLLELMTEFARIISFAFRLFGNIFAGSVLLFVMGSLIPVVVQSGFLFLELFVGLIQALVFGMLTLVFMTMATMAHDEHGEENEEAH
ncbi:MAG: F0F1 ATP synthase subunit A [Anaerolineales bacterium]|nr:F0F1 ATP synthase subunit A [Anaerolineales bacterium]